VAADVVEGAQFVVGAADHDERLGGNFGGEELAWRGHLVGAANGDPVAGEDLFTFELGETRVEVSGCGDRGCLLERDVGVVESEQVGEGLGHARFLSRTGRLVREAAGTDCTMEGWEMKGRVAGLSDAMFLRRPYRRSSRKSGESCPSGSFAQFIEHTFWGLQPSTADSTMILLGFSSG
jgi:hypothetical protein